MRLEEATVSAPDEPRQPEEWVPKALRDAARDDYWERVEKAARLSWAEGRFGTLEDLVTDARAFVDEIERQRRAEERGGA